MALAVVGFLRDKLQLLQVELSSGWVAEEASQIRAQLQSIEPFLRDADARAAKDPAAKKWVKELRQVVLELEDVLDEMMLIQPPRLHLRHGLCGILLRSCSGAQAVSHKLAVRLTNINSRLHKLLNKCANCRLHSEQGRSSEDSMIRFPRNGSWDIDNNHVGIEKAREELLKPLLDSEKRLRTVVIVGMGGLGKTTLAKHIYSSHLVKNRFECRAWITASQGFQAAQQSLMEQFHASTAEELWNYLHKKRYLFVLDDLWRFDVLADLRKALPDDRWGSRVLITTRNFGVASSTYGHLYQLQPLNEADSKSLLYQTAFPLGTNHVCPQELVARSEFILKRCGGLPLAIAVMGGLLSTKPREEMVWERYVESLRSQMETNPYLRTLQRTIGLSFNDLPHPLQSCLLYMSLFPEGAWIRFTKLVRLWAAEGFIHETNGKTEEEVAEDYLYTLARRSLVQVSEIFDDGRLRSCRVHGLIRDVICLVAKEHEFAVSSSANDVRVVDGMRRISIKGSSFGDGSPDMELSRRGRLRSLFMLGDGILGRSLHYASPHLRLLRVLDLGGANLNSFPNGVENLLLLRYLSLRNTRIKTLPRSLGRLENLETLDLKRTQICSLPPTILRLQRLRHLLIGGIENNGVLIPKGIGKLKQVRTMKRAIVAKDGVAAELGSLNLMRCLHVANLRGEDARNLCYSVQNMSCLLALKAIAMEGEMLDLQAVTSSPPLLRRLHLGGRLKRISSWIESAQSLVKICLEGSQLGEDPLKRLQSLKHLAVLSLIEAYDGDKLCCDNPEGFQKLKVLKIVKLHRLISIQVTKGAMGFLQKLELEDCGGLQAVPTGIEHLSQLQELHLVDMPDQLTKNIAAAEKGKDHNKVQHIPVIRIRCSFKNHGPMIDRYNLASSRMVDEISA